MGSQLTKRDGPRTATVQANHEGRLTRLRDRLYGHLSAFGPLLVLASLLSGIGLAVGATIGYETAFDGSSWFFQLVLAGALMALLRNEVGLPTYGLFGPVVIAFILIGAGPLWGLMLFVNVLAVTLFSHRALGRLKLGTAPRLAVLLSVAAIGTALVGAAAQVGELPSVYGRGQVFFPVIISAWYADRAASEIEERGWTVPAKRLLGTLVAVVLSFALISSETVVNWFVTTPPAWGVTLLLIAYLGSRPGFRLSEYLRFDGHYDGKLGPLSVARVRIAYRLRRRRQRVAAALGREVDDDTLDPDAEILSMKRRNKYIEEYNPPHLRPAADEKATINKRFTGLGVASPQTYAVVESPGEFDAARRVVRSRSEFVVKPSQGYGGEGIVVVSGRDGDTYETSRGPLSEDGLLDHIRRIVDGHYSELNADGEAIIEEKLDAAPFMRDLHGEGVADIRVIVFQGYPVMTMTRLPTQESDGAANLHLGAVGVGLSLDDGTPLGAYQQSQDRELETHPDTRESLTDFQVPNWEGILRTAMEAAAASGLGYTGVDVVLTRGNVPKVLEVNVRPGLGIQNTTGAGIFERLEFVKSLPPECEFLPPSRKLELAREWAAADYADEVRPDGEDLLVEDATSEETADAEDEPTAEAAHRDDASTPAQELTQEDGAVDLGGDDTQNADEGGTVLVRTAGLIASGTLLIGAYVVGIPILIGLFVFNAIGFVLGLCAQACGISTSSGSLDRVG